MPPTDVACILALLQRYYGSAWPELTQAGIACWVSELRPYPCDLAAQAVRQWYRTHLPDRPPTLAQLVTLTQRLAGVRARRLGARGETAAPGRQEPLYEPS